MFFCSSMYKLYVILNGLCCNSRWESVPVGNELVENEVVENELVENELVENELVENVLIENVNRC